LAVSFGKIRIYSPKACLLLQPLLFMTRIYDTTAEEIAEQFSRKTRRNCFQNVVLLEGAFAQLFLQAGGC
jgi:hypothetical protein